MLTATIGRRRPGDNAAKLGLAAVSFVAVALLAEVFLRVVMPVWYRQPPDVRSGDTWRELLHRRSSTPGLAYELQPGVRQVGQGAWVETNSFGMRDREPLPADTPSLFRIAVLGDSVTFGFGVAGDLTYPKVLDRVLNGSALGHQYWFDVLNFGVAGYSTRDEAVVFEHKALRWRPRAVVIGYVLNDPETDPIQPLHSYYQPVHWWQHSHLLRLAAQAANAWQIWTKGRGDYVRYLHEPRAGKWKGVEQAFANISRLAREGDVRVIVAILPIIPAAEGRWDGASWSDYPYRDIHAQVAALARVKGFDVVDLLERFSRYEPASLRVSRADGHPSALGHEVIAAALRTHLEDALIAKTGGEPRMTPAELEMRD